LYPLPQCINVFILFHLLCPFHKELEKKQNEFLEFISIEKQKEESNIQSERFFKFITTPIEGAGPEDF